MGIQKINENYRSAETEGLRAINRCFPDFCKTVLQSVKEKCVSSKIKNVCQNLHLFAVIFYKVEKEEKGYLFAESAGIELAPAMDFIQIIKEKNPGTKIENRKIKEIENTGTIFSSSTASKVKIIWMVTYPDAQKTNTHIIIANVILDILEEIGNLKLIQDYQDAVGEYFEKKGFVECYINAIKKCFPEMPDVDIITDISLHNYETRESCGIVCFLDDTTLIEGTIVRFDKKCFLKGGFRDRNNVEGIRKLLEMCRNDSTDDENCSSLIVSGSEKEKGEIIGVLYKKKIWEEKQCLSIRFGGTKWGLYCGMERILFYRNGKYYISDEEGQDELEKKCINGGISFEIFGRLLALLEGEAHHGALVIVAEDAKSEVERLCVKYGRGVKLADIGQEDDINKKIVLSSNKQKMDDNLRAILGMTNLDGAIFFDYKGMCHGFSVILDGKAKVPGEKKRGARYNSAVNYIVNTKTACRCALIRSEDKEKGIEVISSEQVREKYNIVL